MKTIKSLLLILSVIVMVSCQQAGKKQITIFYTADEHGWLNDAEKADGAAALMSIWKEKEGYDINNDEFVVVSGGDMWTGSSVSTLFNGYSMLEVMNTLGYDVAALGNHEFDFTIDTLALRAEQSNFPFLAANLTYEDGSIPSFAKPYTIINANGLKVGVLGLANIATPATANPSAMEGLVFSPYNKALRQYMPELEKDGADFVIIVGHICKEEMESLVPIANEYGIPLITGGHCHSEVLEKQDGVLLIETGAYLTSYIKVVMEYDARHDIASVLEYEYVENASALRDEDMAAIVNKWDTKAHDQLGKVIGYTESGIARKSKEMEAFVADSWLSMIDADFVMVNKGGIRQDIETGDITLGTILGLLPFNNEIVKMTFTADEMNDFVKRQADMHEEYIIAGELDLDNLTEDSYVVLTTNYLYSLEENNFKVYDTAPISTGIVYREPTMQWVESLGSTKAKPIESILAK